MSEFLSMGGKGAYVWAAYGITIAVLVWNLWSARSLVRRRLKQAAMDSRIEEPARRPKVSEL